jgi:ParB family transcriptional regulator, chromosome partitioning protein
VQKRGLGRGLESLIPGLHTSEVPLIIDGVDGETGGRLKLIEIDNIVPNPRQPRKIFEQEALDELVLSIKEHGIIQPIVVREAFGKFELIVGERRWRAAKEAGLDRLPAIIRNSTDIESIELALIENLQRKDLNALEEAAAYYHLLEDFQFTQEELAKRVGKKRSTVANSVRLLKLPDEVKALIEEGKVAGGHGKAILSLPTPELQIRLAHHIAEKGLTVRASEHIARLWMNKSVDYEGNEMTKVQVPVHYKMMADNLQSKIGSKIRLKMADKNRGKLEMHFKTQEELKQLFEFLGEDEIDPDILR